jgi:hypothetical protein
MQEEPVNGGGRGDSGLSTAAALNVQRAFHRGGECTSRSSGMRGEGSIRISLYTATDNC